jgi:putative CocE/NonD family hydrolase
MTADVTHTVPPRSDDRIVVERDVRIPTHEPGVTLSADLYRPASTDPVPALVTVSPYRKDYVAGSTYDAPARWFAAHGYASVVVDLRGTGASDGLRRPEFDPGDGDDAVATIGWAAAQTWCDGSVGAWGISYAANTTLRAASRQPPALRAIIAVAHTLDAGRHSVHPDGARGDLHALLNRGGSMLLQQVLPPLVDYASPQAQARWRQRLHEVEPVLLDYARRGPDDPSWSQEAIRGADITVPALLVGGWRDSFAGGLTEAYHRLAGPKRLVIGPWGHVLPHESGHGPVDFLAVALRWWDEWLRGDPPAEEPAPVLVSLGENEWRAYDTWPPTTTCQRLVAAADALVQSAGQPFVPRQPARPADPVGRYVPDPTVGMLRGLPGLGLGESCPPQDQHDDDLRCVHATGAPLPADVVVAGQPQVTVRLDAAVTRVVVRLCAVDRAGRSTLVSTGVLRPAPGATEHRIALAPVHARIPAGARLRVTIGDADFPRLTPLPSPLSFTVQELALLVPVVPLGTGRPVALPAAAHRPSRSAPVEWTIVRGPARGYAEVTTESETGPLTSRDGHQYQVRGHLSAAVNRDAPSAFRATGMHVAEVRLCTGEHIKVTVSIRCTQDAVYAHAQVTIDGFAISDRRWRAALDRE